jgi:hypothetical protein
MSVPGGKMSLKEIALYFTVVQNNNNNNKKESSRHHNPGWPSAVASLKNEQLGLTELRK